MIGLKENLQKHSHLGRADLSVHFLKNAIYAAALIILIYSGLYWSLHAYLAAYASLACLLFYIPPMLFYLSKNDVTKASFLTILATNSVVTLVSLSLRNKAGAEYYYLPGMMLSLILFEPRHKKYVVLTILIPLLGWLYTSLAANPFEDSGLLSPENFPYKVFSVSNFISSTILISIYVKSYSLAMKKSKDFELEAEHKLMTSSKMVSLGELASGIAHEINNPLSVILGRTQLLKNKLEDLDPKNFDPEVCKNSLEKIENTANLIAKIVKGLKDFSRNSDNDPILNHSIYKIINFSVELCSDRLNLNQIQLETDLGPEVKVKCRDVQIIQVLVNLINNAIDAVEKMPNKWIKVYMNSDSKFLYLSVIDSGRGISEATANKLMQPFFSTKEAGKGLGLGLSISKGIIEAHSGRLIYDPNSQNTKFTIELPLTY